MEILFGISIWVIFWTFLGYPLLLFALSQFYNWYNEPGTISNPESCSLPFITIIIAAYNEERVIKRRITNCLELDYPKDKLEVIVGSDGSTDNTVKIARSIPDDRVKVLDFPTNRGRSQVHNDCVRQAKGEILFFTDASTLYQKDCIKKMIHHYTDKKVGFVGGKIIFKSSSKKVMGKVQRAYWWFEYNLRRWQSQLGILTKVGGANMSLRKRVYKNLPETFDIDQAAGLLAIYHGYRVIYEPEAIAFEKLPTSISGELAARKRFTIQALTALSHYINLFNPFHHFKLTFHLISYRLFRYLTPFCLMAVFVSTGLLFQKALFYQVTFLLQCLFYLLAFGGLLIEKKGLSYWFLSWPFVFCLFNVGILIGDIQFLLGKRVKAYQSRE